MKECNMAIMIMGFSLRPLLLAISPNPVKVSKCFRKLKGLCVCHCLAEHNRRGSGSRIEEESLSAR